MFGTWSDFGRTFAAMDELRRHVERTMDEGASWPRVGVWDAGDNLVLRADLPGVTEKDLKIELGNDVLTVAATRKADAPAGHAVLRQERAPLRFSRSFTMPCKVDADRIAAALKDGVLTVTIPKASASQPRQIAVKAA